jgi:8-oxo-dGTP diphosphatase
MTTVLIGVVKNAQGFYLLGRKKQGYTHEGLWEFPGGKQEIDESEEKGIVRELVEEFGLSVEENQRLFSFKTTDYTFIVFSLSLVSGPLHALDHDVWGWFSAEEMFNLEMGEADRLVRDYLLSSVRPGPFPD